jgi:hypothetical protein
LIPVEDQSTSYFLRPVGISDPSEFIAAESQRIPFKAALSKPHEWQDVSRTGPCPQLQAGEIGTRGCLMMTAPRQAIGIAFALLIV